MAMAAVPVLGRQCRPDPHRSRAQGREPSRLCRHSAPVGGRAVLRQDQTAPGSWPKTSRPPSGASRRPSRTAPATLKSRWTRYDDRWRPDSHALAWANRRHDDRAGGSPRAAGPRPDRGRPWFGGAGVWNCRRWRGVALGNALRGGFPASFSARPQRSAANVAAAVGAGFSEHLLEPVCPALVLHRQFSDLSKGRRG